MDGRQFLNALGNTYPLLPIITRTASENMMDSR